LLFEVEAADTGLSFGKSNHTKMSATAAPQRSESLQISIYKAYRFGRWTECTHERRRCGRGRRRSGSRRSGARLFRRARRLWQFGRRRGRGSAGQRGRCACACACACAALLACDSGSHALLFGLQRFEFFQTLSELELDHRRGDAHELLHAGDEAGDGGGVFERCSATDQVIDLRHNRVETGRTAVGAPTRRVQRCSARCDQPTATACPSAASRSCSCSCSCI
jgi:hypothetical protein